MVYAVEWWNKTVPFEDHLMIVEFWITIHSKTAIDPYLLLDCSDCYLLAFKYLWLCNLNGIMRSVSSFTSKKKTKPNLELKNLISCSAKIIIYEWYKMLLTMRENIIFHNWRISEGNICGYMYFVIRFTLNLFFMHEQKLIRFSC